MRNLIFNPDIAKHKPSNKDECPFCKKDNLGAILDFKDDILWLENKYPTIENSYQTLIIESDEHLGDVSNYDEEHLIKLFSYSFAKWQELSEDPRFESVIFFKNFGPRSGGSLRHPHMQIVGLTDLDAYKQVSIVHFKGLEVQAGGEEEAAITLSLDPLSGYTEFNVLSQSIDQLALATQQVTAYLLNNYFEGRCDSYNLFFYQLEGQYVCKVLPRFITSPYFLGYLLPQRHNQAHLEELKEDFLDFIAEKNKVG